MEKKDLPLIFLVGDGKNGADILRYLKQLGGKNVFYGWDKSHKFRWSEGDVKNGNYVFINDEWNIEIKDHRHFVPSLYKKSDLPSGYTLKELPSDADEIKDKPKIICYCGSLRVAIEAFKKAEYQSVLDGNIALLPCCMFVDIQREYGAESDYKIKADELHKRKIDLCDEVFVLNVGGYIGESTRSEIEYAERIGKPVKYLETTAQNLLNKKS